MKAPVWLGITAALITTIAHAQAEQPVSGSRDANLVEKYLVRVNPDGTAVLTNREGKELVLSPRFVEVIRRVNLKELPAFKSNNPCIGTVK